MATYPKRLELENKILLLTGVKLTEKQKRVITTTDVFKVALNHHAKELKPDIRFTSDYNAETIRRIDALPVYSVRDKKGILVNAEHTGSSLVDCCNWLKDKQILLIADNNYNTQEMQYLIKTKLAGRNNLYKFTKEGNFDLPYITLEEFLNG